MTVIQMDLERVGGWDRDRQTERQTDRQTGRQTGRQADRGIDVDRKVWFT